MDAHTLTLKRQTTAKINGETIKHALPPGVYTVLARNDWDALLELPNGGRAIVALADI